MEYLTYAHYKPDGSIFYIGKGSSKRAHSRSGRNVIWNRTVAKHGGFTVEVLAKWATEQEAFSHEILLINAFRDMGHNLSNISDGGLGSIGFRHSESHKAKLSERMKKSNPMNFPGVRKKQRERLQVAMNRPDVRLHQSAARIGMKLSKKHIESLRVCHPMRPCVINAVEYPSLMEASRETGIRHGTLYRWFNNPHVKHGKKYAHILKAMWLPFNISVYTA